MRLFFSFAFGLALLFLSGERSTNRGANSRNFIRPPQSLEQFSMGYHEVLADSLWIRLIQDFSVCEKPRLPDQHIDASSMDQILGGVSNKSSCPGSWVHSMLSTIVELAPRFRYAYWTGANNLIVGVDDLEGGQNILERGLKQFPDYWQLSYLGAYLYMYELKDVTRAADLLLQAHANGGPSWLPILAARLYSSKVSASLAESVLRDFIQSQPDQEAKERALKRYRELTGREFR